MKAAAILKYLSICAFVHVQANKCTKLVKLIVTELAYIFFTLLHTTLLSILLSFQPNLTQCGTYKKNPHFGTFHNFSYLGMGAVEE